MRNALCRKSTEIRKERISDRRGQSDHHRGELVILGHARGAGHEGPKLAGVVG